MNKSYIFSNYNLDKILSAKQLAELSKTYIDNEESIIVMMIKKKKPPQQPPQGFKEFADRQEKHGTKQLEFNESIVKRLDKHDKMFKAHGGTK